MLREGSRRAFGRSGTFLPPTLPSLAAWYRFNTGITVTGSGVSQWNDQSGNARHLLQASDPARPPKQTDGSLLFDGVAQFLSSNPFALNQPTTIYILGRQITWVLNAFITDGNADSTLVMQQGLGVSPHIRIFAGSNGPETADFVLNTYNVIAAVFNGASSTLQIGLGATVSGGVGANNAGGFRIGCRVTGPGNFSNIQVKEIVIYSAAHDATTRSLVINYLRTLI